MRHRGRFIVGALVVLSGLVCRASVKTVVDRNDNESATADFKFKNVPSPARGDAATGAAFEIVDGEKDDNSGGLEKLHDGKLPAEADQPGENFFFNAGTDGGRILIDLGRAIEIKQINTYSWHPGTRGPQVYKLYGSDGTAKDFNPRPKVAVSPKACGWTPIASVDTRPKQGEPGGQYGVSISDSDGPVGRYRYLLFDIRRTEDDDQFGNTFYSEIDVIDAGSHPEPVEPPPAPLVLKTDDGKYEITFDTSHAPDLSDWVRTKLAPVCLAWYPKIVQMLPSDGFDAPHSFAITFRGNLRFPAATGGTRIICNSDWFKQNLDGEAAGAVVHEMVHVVQQYGRRQQPAAQRPGWLVEGIPDYIRWFKYEPQTHGADITRRNISRARYDGSYRVSANFLNWVTDTYDHDLIKQLNTALRQGKYDEDLWKQLTGKSVEELGDEWKQSLAQRLGVRPDQVGNAKNNTLTDREKAAGWKLLFDGKTLDGWHSFKKDNVLPGWQVKDGVLACVDPQNAGDLCTNDRYDWFELQLDYNISRAGNSGIMYHVTDEGRTVWETGPEYQLLDNKEADDPQKSGWLYDLYSADVDATKPAGQWNHVRLLITPRKCQHDMNGVKYFDYVLGSDDFKARVAKSKFASMPHFAKSDTGYIALQGDHGRVAFRNIKLRVIEGKR